MICFRDLRTTDFDSVRELSIDPRPIDADVLARLKREFVTSVSASASRSVFVYETEFPWNGRGVGLILGAFITPEFAEDLRNSPAPYIAAKAYECVVAGRVPFPTDERMAELNASEGLDLMIVQWAVAESLTVDQGNVVKSEMLRRFIEHHGGWRLRSIVSEACYSPLCDGLRRVGFSDWNSYDGWYSSQSRLPTGFRPILLGIEKDDTRFVTDQTILSLFRWETPRCDFTRDQIEVLERAMRCLTDAEICEELGLVPEQLRKRWERIRKQIDVAYPGAVRGDMRERAARTLDFLRTHLYELRPFGSTRRRGAGRPRGSV